jgi:regulator of sigma E protease
LIAITGILWSIAFFIVAMAPLIFIHEMGHYLVGRWCGVKAEVFSIGFGHPVTGWTDKRGTRWQIGWIPFGGYVRFAGDMSAISEPSDEWLALPVEERNRTFQSKAVWRRALIVAAGPVTNFIVAMMIIAGIFATYGEPRIAPEVGSFAPGSAAQAAGVQVGDRITAIDGQAIAQFEDIGLIVQARASTPITFSIMRKGASQTITVTPKLEQVKDVTGVMIPAGRIGISPAKVDFVPLSILELPGAAARFTVQSVRTTITAVGQIIAGTRSIKELGGPVKIAQTSGAVAEMGFVSFLFFMAMVSINLGFINLLPIPVLDGGHLAFYAVEAIQRKPVGPRAQEWAFRSGLALVLALMIFVTANDLGLWNRLAGLIG